MDREALVALEKRQEDSWKRSGSGPDCFSTISFANARFNGRIDFSGRTFARAADFNYARFCHPPVFKPATNFNQIDFTGAYIGFGRPGRFCLTFDSKVLSRLRDFRKIAEEKRDDDRERDLYIEVRKAELGVHLVNWYEDLKNASLFERLFSPVALITHVL